MKKEKNRLEKEFIELCLEIERQQKELQNYKFKVQVAHKEAEYYSRQIKEKAAILDNLESHYKKKKSGGTVTHSNNNGNLNGTFNAGGNGRKR